MESDACGTEQQKLQPSSPLRSPNHFSCSTPTKRLEVTYHRGPGGVSDVSLRTPRGSRYYNPFLRWDPSGSHGITMSPGAFTTGPPPPDAEEPGADFNSNFDLELNSRLARRPDSGHSPSLDCALSPDAKGQLCPDFIDGDACKQEIYSAQLDAHWSSQVGVQSVIEAFFKSQVVAPSPSVKCGEAVKRRTLQDDAGDSCDAEDGDTPKSSAAAVDRRSLSLNPLHDTADLPRWHVSTQTMLSIPTFFDLNAILTDDDEQEEATSPDRGSCQPAAPLTPDRVPKAFQVVTNAGSPRLSHLRPRLLPSFQPMEAIKERSYCSLDTTDSLSQHSQVAVAQAASSVNSFVSEGGLSALERSDSACVDGACLFSVNEGLGFIGQEAQDVSMASVDSDRSSLTTPRADAAPAPDSFQTPT